MINCESKTKNENIVAKFGARRLKRGWMTIEWRFETLWSTSVKMHKGFLIYTLEFDGVAARWLCWYAAQSYSTTLFSTKQCIQFTVIKRFWIDHMLSFKYNTTTERKNGIKAVCGSISESVFMMRSLEFVY